MKPIIYIVKVAENLSLSSPSRIIGWFETLQDAIFGLAVFGHECRWNYAYIESCPCGVHESNELECLFQYIEDTGYEGCEESSSWITVDKENLETAKLTFNHTIG